MIQLTDKLFAIPVPEDATKFKFNNANYVCQVLPENGYYIELHEKPLKGEYLILGTATKDTIDFDVEPIVEKHYYYPSYYRDYNSDNTIDDWYKHPIGSFRSLLTSKNILFENPYDEYKQINIATGRHEAFESQLVKKILIIEKI